MSRVLSLLVLLFTTKTLPVANLRELIALVRWSAHKPLSYASTGAGGLGHLPIVGMEKLEGMRMIREPYRGAAAWCRM